MTMKQTETQRNQWSSNWNFILAATGAAVGLGNIWKFPYMVGDHGGGAFVLIYLLWVLLIGLPLMMAEMLIGRSAQCNCVNALALLAKKYQAAKSWPYLAWWGASCLLLVLSFYSVVASWSIAYLYKSLLNQFQGLQPQAIQHLWENLLQQPLQLIGLHTLFMSMTMIVVALGVQTGIERAAKIMMPGLFLILAILCIYAYQLPGFWTAVHFLCQPHWNAITIKVIINALGLAFFTLAIGAGCMLAYGCYIPKESHIGKAVLNIALLDILVAFLSGMAIFPIVFSYNLPTAEGPGLMFKILPVAFAKMPFGQGLGILFFLLLLFAALTSTFSLAEPLVVLIMEKKQLSRKKSALIIGISAWLLGLLPALSFNVLHSYTLWQYNAFTLMTDLTTNIMLPVGGIGFAIFAGWCLPKKVAADGLPLKSVYVLNIWQFLLRYLVPLGISSVLISTLFS
jgi:neurotransmitter:Na+ symporter, NSS family